MEKKSGATHKRTLITSAAFPTEALKARREQNDIFKTLKEKNCQPQILYLAKLSFRNKGKIKMFPNKYKLRVFITTKPALQ